MLRARDRGVPRSEGARTLRTSWRMATEAVESTRGVSLAAPCGMRSVGFFSVVAACGGAGSGTEHDNEWTQAGECEPAPGAIELAITPASLPYPTCLVE